MKKLDSWKTSGLVLVDCIWQAIFTLDDVTLLSLSILGVEGRFRRGKRIGVVSVSRVVIIYGLYFCASSCRGEKRILWNYNFQFLIIWKYIFFSVSYHLKIWFFCDYFMFWLIFLLFRNIMMLMEVIFFQAYEYNEEMKLKARGESSEEQQAPVIDKVGDLTIYF